MPFEGSVVKVTDQGPVIVNRGAEFGVARGQELVLVELGERLLDSDTGEILGEEEDRILGKVRVSKVSGKVPCSSVIEGKKNPQPGSVVRTE